MNEPITKEEPRKKGFWGRLLDKLDKKMEQKAKQPSCCSPSDKGKQGSSGCC